MNTPTTDCEHPNKTLLLSEQRIQRYTWQCLHCHAIITIRGSMVRPRRHRARNWPV